MVAPCVLCRCRLGTAGAAHAVHGREAKSPLGAAAGAEIGGALLAVRALVPHPVRRCLTAILRRCPSRQRRAGPALDRRGAGPALGLAARLLRWPPLRHADAGAAGQQAMQGLERGLVHLAAELHRELLVRARRHGRVQVLRGTEGRQEVGLVRQQTWRQQTWRHRMAARTAARTAVRCLADILRGLARRAAGALGGRVAWALRVVLLPRSRAWCADAGLAQGARPLGRRGLLGPAAG
mmetsp:Transcript_87778/g.226235  ORF Transcript_87778/g.226235 Transcript_87778/m.226235 type:complete len:238 (-) Transcript_87778:1058-1771(-)